MSETNSTPLYSFDEDDIDITNLEEISDARMEYEVDLAKAVLNKVARHPEATEQDFQEMNRISKSLVTSRSHFEDADKLDPVLRYLMELEINRLFKRFLKIKKKFNVKE